MQRRPVLRVLGSGLVLALLVIAGAPDASATPPASTRSYIVTLTPSNDAAASARADLPAVGSSRRPDRVFDHAVRGYVAQLTDDEAARLSRRPGVVGVEPDQQVSLDTTQPNPPWGIDRIDQRTRPVNASYTYTATGTGVKAYIIDTGIRATHQDFGGRVQAGVNTVDGTPSTQDCNGHGTHVSGTVGGATYGVAKGVTLVAVRVFGCGSSTSTSTIIAGLDWAAANHQAGQPAVANMSLGGGASTALDNTVRGLIADGVLVAIAAGNGNALGMPVNSCGQSPARVAEGITVSASNSNDAKASFANYGTCVDLFAPGVDILSSWGTSDTATNTISGTSMATPHVVGVVAQYLQLHPSATAAQVQTAVKDLSTKGVVTGTGGGLFGGATPNNHLLFTNM